MLADDVDRLRQVYGSSPRQRLATRSVGDAAR